MIDRHPRGPDRRQRRLSMAPAALPELPGDAMGEQAAPFLRPEHRTRVRRQRRGLVPRAILALQILAVLVLAASGAWTAYGRVMASERLKVGRLEVRGIRFLSEGEVRALIAPALGENILALDLVALQSALRSSPWVEDATVVRTLPDTLRVTVQERVPLALAEVERLYLMAADGTLIDVYGPRTAGFDLPIVRGLQHVDLETRRERAHRAGALLADLGDLGDAVSEVEVEKGGDLRVVMRGAGEVLKMGAAPYRSRLVTFLSLREELRLRCPRAEAFDLRFAGRIYAIEPHDPQKDVSPLAPRTLPATAVTPVEQRTPFVGPPEPLPALPQPALVPPPPIGGGESRASPPPAALPAAHGRSTLG